MTRAELPAFSHERRADPAWRGCNVTMPLKLDALMLADDASDRAVAAGAANILFPRTASCSPAIPMSARSCACWPRCSQQRSGRTAITLLGNGGAARAVLLALRLLDVADVRIQARDMAEATKLAVEFGLGSEPRAVRPCRSTAAG